MWYWRVLDYKNCKCRKWLIDKLVEECSENADGNKVIYNVLWTIMEKYAILVQYTLYY